MYYILVLAHIIPALICPILDCDEVYNYWEPMHNLIHGHGFQTWEYAGQYALRSYLYLLIHAPIIAIISMTSQFFGNSDVKIVEFYCLRVVLAITTATCEAHWLEAMRRKIGEKTQLWCLFFLILSPGLFIASAAFIPSSFAMCCLMLVQSFHLRGHIFKAILTGAIGGVVGWPFCIIALVPLGVEILRDIGLLRSMLFGAISLIVTVLPTILADTYFYLLPREGIVFSTWNMVLYNIMPRGTGSELYGTEKWHFYLRNLALNFNVALPCALTAPIMIGFHYLQAQYRPSGSSKSHQIVLVQILPFFVWFFFFSLIPHKEERFMFVVYPQLCLSAAVTLASIEALHTTKTITEITREPQEFRSYGDLNGDENFNSKAMATKMKPMIHRGESHLGSTFRCTARILVFLIGVCFTMLSIGRSAALYHHYGAPITSYKFLNHYIRKRFESSHINEHHYTNSIRVCVGKEWYRFPSHFFLPEGSKLAFLESGFRGQLPQLFDPTNGTRGIPPNFNEINEEETDRYVETLTCDFVVDLGVAPTSHYSFQSTKTQRYDPWHPGGGTCGASWRLIHSSPFLDAERTSFLARILFLPPFTNFPSTEHLPYEVFEKGD